MTQEYRGGNSRLLAKSLDQLQQPLAVLDRRGIILFANSALCALAAADATSLVGKQCSWQIAPDDAPFAAILTALAPPAGALQGKLVARRLTTPIVFGSTATGQLFLPLLDEDQLVHQTMVVLGKWEDIASQIPSDSSVSDVHRRQRLDRTLVAIRSQWKTLDHLTPLIGESPAIQLAMTRAQLAVANDCHFLVSGPPGVGKSKVVQGVFLGRLHRAGVQRIAAQYLPLDCSLLDDNLLVGMLEVFSGRLRENSPRAAQQLLLERVEALSEPSVEHLLQWLREFGSQCTLSATSRERAEELVERGERWQALVSSLAQLEIHLPALHQRREDIGPLAQQALASFCQRTERAQIAFSPGAIDAISIFPWPQNLAQLTAAVEDAVQHAVLSARVQTNHLPVAVRTFPSSALQAGSASVEPIDLDAVLLDLEKIVLQRAIKLSPRNRAQAARWLGISRARFLRRIAQLGLDDRPTPGEDSADDEA